MVRIILILILLLLPISVFAIDYPIFILTAWDTYNYPENYLVLEQVGVDEFNEPVYGYVVHTRTNTVQIPQIGKDFRNNLDNVTCNWVRFFSVNVPSNQKIVVIKASCTDEAFDIIRANSDYIAIAKSQIDLDVELTNQQKIRLRDWLLAHGITQEQITNWFGDGVGLTQGDVVRIIKDRIENY